MELDHRITIWTVGNISQTSVLLFELLGTLESVHGTVTGTLWSIECNLTALLTELLESWGYVTVSLFEMSGILKTDRPGAQPYLGAVL